MSDKEKLLALADRVEREESSDDLSEAIAEAIGWTNLNKDNCLGEGIVRWVTPDKRAEQRGFGPPAYTTSLDAAVTLELPEWNVVVRKWDEGNGVEVLSFDARHHRVEVKGLKTEPMARCAAALRAIAATKGE